MRRLQAMPVITTRVSTTVVSETHLYVEGWPVTFSGHPRGLWLGEYLDGNCTGRANGSRETHPRTFIPKRRRSSGVQAVVLVAGLAPSTPVADHQAFGVRPDQIVQPLRLGSLFEDHMHPWSRALD